MVEEDKVHGNRKGVPAKRARIEKGLRENDRQQQREIDERKKKKK
jgi:hypothetical protein